MKGFLIGIGATVFFAVQTWQVVELIDLRGDFSQAMSNLAAWSQKVVTKAPEATPEEKKK